MRGTLALLSLVVALLPVTADDYVLGPYSQRHEGTPRGVLTKFTWTSTIYPGTTRDYWVYAPAQYNPARPACVMVFQDGGGFLSDTGAWRVPIVFDNLIERKAIPVTLGVFVNPGVLNAASPKQQNRYNRSYEYDGLGDRYARFLIEELLPDVARNYNLSTNPDDRAIAGSSSGGIAAFTAAWNRPDAFHRVLSFIGSYTNLRGGDAYPGLIRKMEPLPLRIFLQDGRNDLNIYAGSWFLSNQEMAAALSFAGYESNFVIGAEGHNSKHGGAILPEALAWLWKDYPKPVTPSHTSPGDRHFITTILDPSSDWELVSGGYKVTEGPAVDRNGNVFFVDTDTPQGNIYKIGTDNKVSRFKDDAEATGLMFGPDGRLYAAQNGRKRIVAYTPAAEESVLAEDVNSNDIAVTSAGNIYFTDPMHHRVWYLDTKGKKQIMDEKIAFPNGIRLSPDESLLLVADTLTRWVWSFQIQPDGALKNGEPFYHLEMPDSVEQGPLRSGADGMTLDSEGYLYVATKLGIQICDQPGRVVGIIRKPSTADPSNLVFGGPDLQTLYVTAGDKVFRRHLRRKGFYPWTPLKPPAPQL